MHGLERPFAEALFHADRDYQQHVQADAVLERLTRWQESHRQALEGERRPSPNAAKPPGSAAAANCWAMGSPRKRGATRRCEATTRGTLRTSQIKSQPFSRPTKFVLTVLTRFRL
jgi:hypothetical protein